MRYRSTSLCSRVILFSLFVFFTQVHSASDTNLHVIRQDYNLSGNDRIVCQLGDAESYTWERVDSSNGRVLVSETNELNKSTLLLHDEGSYICNATNSSGAVSSQEYLISFVYSSGDPIFYIRPSSQSTGSNLQHQSNIRLHWSTFHHARPVSTYSLSLCAQYLAGERPCIEELLELEDVVTNLDIEKLQFNHSYTVRDVLPFHRYRLQLAYTNSDSSWRKEVEIDTDPAPPVVDQVELHLSWTDSRTLDVTWSPLDPKYTSNVSWSYSIFVYRDNEFETGKNVTRGNRATLQLEGHLIYSIQLCAVNVFGIDCKVATDTAIYQDPVNLLEMLPIILIILLAVLIYFALLIICCLAVALFRRRARNRRSTKDALGEFQVTSTMKRMSNADTFTPRHSTLHDADSGIYDYSLHRSHASEEAQQLLSELDEARIRNSKIPLRHLKPCLEQHLENRAKLANEEFADLREGLLKEATVGLLPENNKNNRYPNICPYDSNRIILEDSTYINASMISPDWLTFSYITTQGPLPSSLPSFWQMVWGNSVSVIVMLTPETGPSSCEEYWPALGQTIDVNQLQITHEKSNTFAHFVQRTFVLKCPALSQDKLKVTQLQFTSWPHKSLPVHPHFLWQFIAKVHRHQSSNSQSPLLLHCPDGSKQCGLFLVLFELMLELIQQEPIEINVFELVQRLRLERVNVIPNQEQYAFVYTALLDQVNRTDTSIQKHNFEITCKYMEQKDANTPNSNLYSEQFETLSRVCPDPSPEQLSHARHHLNLKKNRYEDKLPTNLFRVQLDIRLTGETSDYINASYIDSYTQKRMFIATQGPLEHTVPQFWSMVVSTKASLIVMLTNLYEDGREMCAHYWPTSTEMLTIKNLQVSFVDEQVFGAFKVRDYVVTSGQHRQQVSQLHIGNWSIAGTPPGIDEVLQLVKHTSRLHRSLGVDRPVIVHCNDGVGRTGTFLGIYLALEQAVYEGVVDVFQTVKGLRVQRPQMVSSLKQFMYCHKAVLEAINKNFTFL